MLSSRHFCLNASNAASRADLAVGCLLSAPRAATVSVMLRAVLAAAASSEASSPPWPAAPLSAMHYPISDLRAVCVSSTRYSPDAAASALHVA